MFLHEEKGKLHKLTHNFLSNSCARLKNNEILQTFLYKDKSESFCISDCDYSIRLIFPDNIFQSINK